MLRSSEQIERNIRLVVKGDLEAAGPILIFGVVYGAGPLDTDRAAMSPEEVEAVAYDFVASGKLSKIDLMHNERPTGSVIVDSTFIRWENPYFPIHSWVIGVRVSDPGLKLAIKNGEINGFSFGGSAFEVTRFALIIQPLKSVGTTEPSTADGVAEHTHDLELDYDNWSNIIPTMTTGGPDHEHEMIKGTATEMAKGHAHRAVIEPPRLEGEVQAA